MSAWRKSSHSIANGDCVEVRDDWRKSSYSGYNTNCVETASGGAVVVVRDTQDRGGFVLEVPAAAWQKFLSQIR